MDLSRVRAQISDDPRADQIVRLIATAEQVAADEQATARRDRRRRTWITGGTAMALVAGGVGTSVLSRGNEDDELPTPSGRSTVEPSRPTSGSPVPGGTSTTAATTTSLPPPPTSALANAPVGTGLATTPG